jgi:hypothetical protein
MEQSFTHLKFGKTEQPVRRIFKKIWKNAGNVDSDLVEWLRMGGRLPTVLPNFCAMIHPLFSPGPRLDVWKREIRTSLACCRIERLGKEKVQPWWQLGCS